MQLQPHLGRTLQASLFVAAWEKGFWLKNSFYELPGIQCFWDLEDTQGLFYIALTPHIL